MMRLIERFYIICLCFSGTSITLLPCNFVFCKACFIDMMQLSSFSKSSNFGIVLLMAGNMNKKKHSSWILNNL